MDADEFRRGGRSRRMIFRWPLRSLTTLLLFVVVAGTSSLAFVSHEVVRDQDRRLLVQRAAEVSAVVSLSASAIQERSGLMATLVRLGGSDSALFSSAAADAIAAGLFNGVAVVQGTSSGYRIVSVSGAGLTIGNPPPGPDVSALDRAGPDGVFVPTPVYQVGQTRRLGFATLVAGVSPRTVLYGEIVLTPAAQSGTRGPQLFGDLEGAVYDRSRRDTGQLILGTPGFNSSGRSVTTTARIGAGQWVLVLSARKPLVGALAQRQPWLVLASGLLAATLVAALVEVLQRRKQYATALVEERTAQLEETVAQLNSTQEQLVRQERMAAIGKLAAAVGHELRNPLGALNNVVYLLEEKLGQEDPWIDRQLTTAKREVGAATVIVSDLLDFARHREPIFGSVDLHQLVDEALSVAPPPKGIEVARNFPDGLPLARADRDQLRQVVLNIVSNAYDAMAGGGLLAVQAEEVAGGVHLRFGDTGAGMDDATRDHIFEPFFTTKAKGVGLGLSVSHRIVEAHGGTITVSSAVGSGTSFDLFLPDSMAPTAVTRGAPQRS